MRAATALGLCLILGTAAAAQEPTAQVPDLGGQFHAVEQSQFILVPQNSGDFCAEAHHHAANGLFVTATDLTIITDPEFSQSNPCGFGFLTFNGGGGGGGGTMAFPQIFSDEFIGNGLVNPTHLDPEVTRVTPASGTSSPMDQPGPLPQGGVKTFTVPHLLETRGHITDVPNTFDTTIYSTYSSGLGGTPEAGGTTMDLFTFDPTTGVLERIPNGVSPPFTRVQTSPGPFGGELRVNGLQGSDNLLVEHTGPLGGLVGVGLGDRGAAERAGPGGLVLNGTDGDDVVLVGGGEPPHEDDVVYPLDRAIDKMVKKITGPLSGPDQETLRKLILDAFKGLKGTDGKPGKTLEDAAKEAVEKHKELLNKNPDARKVYDGLQEKAQKDAQSSDKHDAARGRQWQRVLDAIGKAAGWPTSPR